MLPFPFYYSFTKIAVGKKLQYDEVARNWSNYADGQPNSKTDVEKH